MKKALLIAGFCFCSGAFAQHGTVMFPTAQQQVDSLTILLNKASALSAKTKFGTVELGTRRFTGLEVSGGYTDHEYILRFETQFQNEQDKCVGVTEIFATKELRTEEVPCNTLQRVKDKIEALREGHVEASKNEAAYIIGCTVVQKNDKGEFELQSYTWLTIVDKNDFEYKGGAKLPALLGSGQTEIPSSKGKILKVKLNLVRDGSFHLKKQMALTLKDGAKEWASSENIVASPDMAVTCRIDQRIRK